jgi:FliI/YscN family ATPase
MRAPLQQVRGRVVQVVGTLVEAELPGATVGGLCRVDGGALCEVVGFRGSRVLMMPLGKIDGVGFGSVVQPESGAIRMRVGDDLVGRVLDGLGRPMDGGPPLRGGHRRSIDGSPPDPLQRTVIDSPLETGVRVLDGLLTLGKGQRIGLMAGSGVGKSTLMGMIARQSRADVNVIALLGERGREVREFLERDLGPEGMARSVVIVVTSDRSPVLQVKGAMVANTVAEFFRDQGKDVMLMMDSLTRVAMAQRQIGLASGEPPTSKGYTPSVFSLLPRVLERAGPGTDGGSITGIYTVLVEADDLNDPIGDAVRGLVDGHVVLSRKLATHGHYPAVDVLQSVSRVMVHVTDPAHQASAARIRSLLAVWEENEELVRLGAYRRGSSAEVDEALSKRVSMDILLRQPVNGPTPMQETIEAMRRIVAG